MHFPGAERDLAVNSEGLLQGYAQCPFFLLFVFIHLSYLQLPLEEDTTHGSILVWKIPWIEEPGRLQSNKESDMTERISMHAHISVSLVPSYDLTYLFVSWLPGHPEKYVYLPSPLLFTPIHSDKVVGAI